MNKLSLGGCGIHWEFIFLAPQDSEAVGANHTFPKPKLNLSRSAILSELSGSRDNHEPVLLGLGSGVFGVFRGFISKSFQILQHTKMLSTVPTNRSQPACLDHPPLCLTKAVEVGPLVRPSGFLRTAGPWPGLQTTVATQPRPSGLGRFSWILPAYPYIRCRGAQRPLLSARLGSHHGLGREAAAMKSQANEAPNAKLLMSCAEKLI